MCMINAQFNLQKHKTTGWSYLVDEVPDVSGVRGRRAQWVLVIVVQGPLVQAADAHLDAL